MNIVTTANEINVADCCRACLRIDCSLTSTSATDDDSIRFCDKLLACLSEITWEREGLPSLICSSCIEKLRICYDFRTVCLQSDNTLQKYIGHLKTFELTVSHTNDYRQPDTTNVTVENTESSQNTQFIHLKHFLDNEEGEEPKERNTVNNLPPTEFLTEQDTDLGELTNSEVVQQVGALTQIYEQSGEPFSLTQFDTASGATQIIQELEKSNQLATVRTQEIRILPQRPIIKKTTGVQVRPPSPPAAGSAAIGLAKPDKTFTCSICEKTYRKNANLRIHMRTHTGEKPFECKYCDKRFYHSSHLREHIRRHTGEKPFQCAVCNKRFTIRGELTMHIKSHTGEKPYACTRCDRRCLTAADLKVHMRTHTGEKPFECAACGKKFASAYILNSHVKTHTGERPYPCSVCDKTFTQSSHLNVHMRKHTGEKVRCKLCNAEFAHSSQLTVHVREHTGRQPYKCTLCGKVCNYASELQTHTMRHTGEKFACLTCDKKFTTAAYLQEHIRTHTGENLSTCSICKRQFTRHQYLAKHMRTHTGEKPYTCSRCGKKFSQSSSLKVHTRIHTGEKPYACDQCDRKFTTSSDLSTHSKKHKNYIDL